MEPMVTVPQGRPGAEELVAQLVYHLYFNNQTIIHISTTRLSSISKQLDYHLYFNIQRTEKYSIAMCQVLGATASTTSWWSTRMAPSTTSPSTLSGLNIMLFRSERGVLPFCWLSSLILINGFKYKYLPRQKPNDFPLLLSRLRICGISIEALCVPGKPSIWGPMGGGRVQKDGGGHLLASPHWCQSLLCHFDTLPPPPPHTCLCLLFPLSAPQPLSAPSPLPLFLSRHHPHRFLFDAHSHPLTIDR